MTTRGGRAARLLTAVALLALPAWRAAAPRVAAAQDAAAGQGEVVFAVAPGVLELRDTAGVVEIRVTGAPPFAGYQVEVGWDPDLVAVTSVAPGDLLSRAGETVFTPRFVGVGRLALGEVLPAPSPAAALPSGEGALAFVTFAPLGATAAAAVTLTDANLVGPAGEGMPAARTVAGQITVAAVPPEPQIQAAAAQATALATQLGHAGSGRAARWPAELPAVEDLPRPGGNAIWLGLLALALLVVALGWYVGREPPGSRPA